jgi:hypothetical protein
MRIICTTVVTLLLWTTLSEAAIQDPKQSESSSVSVSYNVTCSPKWMIVTVIVNSSTALVYLDRLKTYAACAPEEVEETFVFRLPLDDIYSCGTTRMLNKITGARIYYHRVVVEDPFVRDKQVILVTCSIPPTHNKSSSDTIAQSRTRRNSLPDNFIEPDVVNITEYIQASAPVPYLSIAVQQQGHTLDTTRGVQPGTPLHMIVYLDKKSAETYGLLTSFLKVTDGSPEQEEVIIMNGCSIDPYIFGNFETSNGGDSLSARFRAFKFPDTNHVLFVGTVSVCLQECRGVPCGNGQLGFGRRKRRSVPTDLPPDPNKMFEVEMTTVLKVQYPEQHFTLNKGSLAGDWLPQEDNANSSNIIASHASPAALQTENSALSRSTDMSILLLSFLLLILI